MQMDNILPDWMEKGVEPSLRYSEDDKPSRPVPTAISSSTDSRARGTPVVLTPTTGQRPDSRQEGAKGAATHDLESFYADTASTEESEDENDDDDEGDDDDDESEEGGSEKNEDGNEEDESGSEDVTSEEEAENAQHKLPQQSESDLVR